MSGITGIFRRDGRDVDPDDIKKMNDKIAHRGPDGSRIWCEGPVAFGHQMLHTTQESLHEELPFEDEESGLVITADARIDNRKELAPKLGIEDNEFVSDSYFILKAYEKWGEKCPEELLGDFTFAIWDKNKEQLFCARDHMGVKPFYYHLSDDYFTFSSEIKSILILHHTPKNLNELKIAFHLMHTPHDRKFTFYKDIFSLTAANFLKISGRNFVKSEYWKLDPNRQIIFDNDDKYFSTFREIFTEAVNCRLRAAFPIGFELSGGLDSSSVVSISKKILSKKKSDYSLKTFSLVFDELPEVDESYYITKIINDGNIEASFLFGDKISPLENVKTILWYQDQPFSNILMSLHWHNFKKMEKNEIRILLGGTGGDQVLSKGNNYLRDLAASGSWKLFFRELKGYSKRTNQKIFYLFSFYFLSIMLPKFVRKKLFEKILKINFLDCTRDFNILNDQFKERLGGEDYLNDIAGTSDKITESLNTARKHHYSLLNQLSHQYVLESQNKLASSYSIEVRHPFYDKRVLEFCYSVPDDIKFRYGWDRYLLRVAMDNILPKEIQWRPLKKYFTGYAERNLLLEKKCLNRYLFLNKKIQSYVNPSILRRMYEKYESKEYKRGIISTCLWDALILSLWLK